MKKLLLLAGIITMFQPAFAKNAGWQEVAPADVHSEGAQQLHPTEYKTYWLDNASMKDYLFRIEEGSEHAIVMSIPAPGGKERTFRVWQQSVMAPALAAKYPGIKNFTAVAVDDPTVTAKINYTYRGFDAMVYDGDRTYFIDPYSDVNDGYYICYYKNEVAKTGHGYTCKVGDPNPDLPGYNKQDAISLDKQEDLPRIRYKTNGTQKKVFRMALACTGEYAIAVAGPNPTKPNVLSKMTTTMTRINGIYERELGTTLQLIGNNDDVIYLDPNTDPYTKNENDHPGNDTQQRNQQNTDNVIGALNYDIGHVLCDGDGGIADLEGLCDNGFKARAASGAASPMGDAFDVDYLAHEIGHQLGAEHTFNSNIGACVGNGVASCAYEPGGGSTIMAYAGICSSDDIQQHSDDYFHAKSLDQMTIYLGSTTVLLCGSKTASGNTPPSFPAITATYEIPYLTPFELEAPAVTDTDHDVLTYCWEEYDLGDFGKTFDNTEKDGPIFRSFKATASPIRVFPALDKLRQNITSYKGEKLPSVDRQLNFRLTVRDMFNGTGAFNFSDNSVTLNVTSASGPFKVMQPNTKTDYWKIGNTYEVKWDVANTTAAPVSCSNVNIYLSLDDGQTWPIVLATNTPNDGTEQITVPANSYTASARVKVKGAGNVFFDMSNESFVINDWPDSIDNLLAKSDGVLLYPVPARHTLHVRVTEGTTFTANITNTLGQKVWDGTISDRANINVGGFATGVYYMNMHNIATGQNITKKITVE